MKYRQHRGSLTDSLKTEIEISSFEELKLFIKKTFNFKNSFVLEIKHYGFDKRLNHDVFQVLCTETHLGTFVVGWTDSDNFIIENQGNGVKDSILF